MEGKTDAEKVQEILDTLTEMEAVRRPYEDTLKECMEYVLPRRSTWDENGEEGKKPPHRLFTTKPNAALKKAADGFNGYMVNRTMPWFKFGLNRPEYLSAFGVGEWLETAEDAVQSALARSNFYKANREFCHDAQCTGTPIMSILEGKDGQKINFSTRHPLECFIANDDEGNVDTVFRVFWMTLKAARSKFGAENLALDYRDKTENLIKTKIKVLHAVYPRADGKANQLTNGKQKPFASIYIDISNKWIMEESGFEELPYVVWPWSKNSNETYGRSPTMDALPDIKMLNQMAKSRIELAQKVSDPPYMAPASTRGEEDLLPHGANYRTNPQDRIEPIPIGANYPIAIDNEKNVIATIEDHYSVEFFVMLAQALQGGGAKTATEVMEIEGEKAAVISATVGGYESDALAPLIKRVFKILIRRGVIPPMPAALSDPNLKLEIEYIGPLAQAIKRHHASAGIFSALNSIGPIIELFPQSLVRINGDELMTEALRVGGMPEKIIRNDDEVKQINDAMAQQQAQAQAQAQNQAQGDLIAQNAQALNQPIRPNSMLDKMAQSQAAQAKAKNPKS